MYTALPLSVFGIAIGAAVTLELVYPRRKFSNVFWLSIVSAVLFALMAARVFIIATPDVETQTLWTSLALGGVVSVYNALYLRVIVY